MHLSASNIGKLFFDKYVAERHEITVVDVGSQNVNGSLSQFCAEGVKYIGVDFVQGKGVDVVLDDPYLLPFASESIDVVVCSSVFEHSEFFWVLYLECIRVLKPDGLFYMNVPSNGYVHRYPVDSWRFYPDAGRALNKWSRHNSYNTVLLESFIAAKEGDIRADGMWNDFVAVVLKDQSFEANYPRRILDDQKEGFCCYNSLRNDDFQMFVQNPDHQLLLERESRIVDLERRLAGLEQQISALHEYITSIFNSVSWRITSPLRYIRGLFR